MVKISASYLVVKPHFLLVYWLHPMRDAICERSCPNLVKRDTGLPLAKSFHTLSAGTTIADVMPTAKDGDINDLRDNMVHSRFANYGPLLCSGHHLRTRGPSVEAGLKVDNRYPEG